MSTHAPKTYEGKLVPRADASFAIVAARFNHAIVDRLLEGAVDALVRHGVAGAQIVVARVPGAWEVPLVARRLASTRRFAGVLALGAVIRGATAHFDVIVRESARGIADAQAATGVPIVNGILTTDTIEQAVERAGTKAGNKGWDAALVALEMASISEALGADGL